MLELRHQRNPDVFFDIHDETRRNGISSKLKKKIYDLIETLLPHALSESSTETRLVELFGNERHVRRGWASIDQKSDSFKIALNK